MNSDPPDSQPWRDAFEPVRAGTGLVQQASWMSVVWPAFLAAAMLELLVFGLLDPHDLTVAWARVPLDQWPRALVYSVSFLVFWLICMACSALTLILAASPKAAVAISRPVD